MKAVFQSGRQGSGKRLPADRTPELLMGFGCLLLFLAPLGEFLRCFPKTWDIRLDTHPLIIYLLFLTAVLYVPAVILRFRHGRTLSKGEENVPRLLFALTTVWILLSTKINGITLNVVFGDIYRRESIFSFLAYFWILYPAAAWISSRREKSILLFAFLIGSIPLAMQQLFIFISGQLSGSPWVAGNCHSVFQQFNHYGYYLTMNVCLSACLIHCPLPGGKILAGTAFLLNSVVLVLNDTFGAYLAALAGLAFGILVCSLCKKRLDWVSVSMLLAFLLVSFGINRYQDSLSANYTQLVEDVGKVVTHAPDASRAGTTRWGLYTSTVRYIRERPLFGFGLEGIGQRLKQEAGTDRPHCEYLQYAAFFGIPAAVLYVSGVFSVFLHGLKHRLQLDLYTQGALIAAFGYLVSACFGNTMYNTAPYLFLLLGLGYSPCDKP